jgi:hypothetical protein
MGLVGESGLRGDHGRREALVQQLPGPAHPQLVEVGVRGQAGLLAERPQQRERAHAGGQCEIVQAGRIGQPGGEQTPDLGDGPGHAAGRSGRQRRRPDPAVAQQQPGQPGPQQRGGGEPVTAFRGDVRGQQQPGAALVVYHGDRERRRAGRPAQVRGDRGHHVHRRVQDPVGPAVRAGGLAGVHGLGVHKDHVARSGPQQAPVVLELLEPGLDHAERERLVRVPAVAVSDEPGAQQVHAGHCGVLPVTRGLGRHIAMLTRYRRSVQVRTRSLC